MASSCGLASDAPGSPIRGRTLPVTALVPSPATPAAAATEPVGTVNSPVSLVVQKFGGTSVADPDRIRAVAEHVVRTRRAGDDVVVVVSAMGKTTDDLERLAHEVSRDP